MVKFKHLVSKERENNKCYAKVCILKSFWKLYKTINKSISCVMFSEKLYKTINKSISWALQGPLKGTWGLGHSKGTWTLTHSRHLATWSIRHRGTRALEGILDTRGTLFSRLRIFNVDCNNRECINKRNCGSFFSETHEEFVNFFSPLFYLMIFPFFSFDETAFMNSLLSLIIFNVIPFICDHLLFSFVM